MVSLIHKHLFDSIQFLLKVRATFLQWSSGTDQVPICQVKFEFQVMMIYILIPSFLLDILILFMNYCSGLLGPKAQQMLDKKSTLLM